MGEQLILKNNSSDLDGNRCDADQSLTGIGAGPHKARPLGRANSSPSPLERMLTQFCLDPTTELFHTPAGRAYATLPVDGHRETWPLDSKDFRDLLCHNLYVSSGEMPSDTCLRNGIGILKGEARFSSPCKPIHVRLAQQESVIYLDLGDKEWRVIRIDIEGWRLDGQFPVKFWRPPGMLPLPLPVEGGNVDELRPFTIVGHDNDWRLLAAWLVQAFRPVGPYPVLCLHGQQGSAKSTVARVLRSLVDPNVSPLRTGPRDERDLAISANNSWLPVFDNLSQ
jgi:hypothetical protein